MKALMLGYDDDTGHLLQQSGYTELTQSVEYLKGDFSQIADTDLIVFLGGADIHPAMYGHENKGSCYNTRSIHRDKQEAEVYSEAIIRGIPCFGICRGFQFLNVMNKGVMRQDVPYHTGNYGHHSIVDSKGEYLFDVNSYHHQQVVLSDMATTADVLYASPIAYQTEVESAVWPETASGGVQWHPEWMEISAEGRLYVEKLLCKLQSLKKPEIERL